MEATGPFGVLGGSESVTLAAPVEACQTRAVPSRLTAPTREPSGEKATVITCPPNTG
jgi:hypothetical protein